LRRFLILPFLPPTPFYVVKQGSRVDNFLVSKKNIYKNILLLADSNNELQCLDLIFIESEPSPKGSRFLKELQRVGNGLTSLTGFYRDI